MKSIEMFPANIVMQQICLQRMPTTKVSLGSITVCYNEVELYVQTLFLLPLSRIVIKGVQTYMQRRVIRTRNTVGKSTTKDMSAKV